MPPNEQPLSECQTLNQTPVKQSGYARSSAPNSDEKATDILDPLRNLRYSDLVYLLNILKLQRAKSEEKDFSRSKWLEDIRLSIQVAMSLPSVVKDPKSQDQIA